MDNQTNQNSKTLISRKVLLTVFGVIILAEVIWAGWVFYGMKSQPAKVSQSVVQTIPTQIELATDQTSVKVGDQFSVSISISSNLETDGADLIINYNPKLLSASPVTLTLLYDDYPLNKIDATLGKITVSGISTGSSGVVPNGRFGTITFKALATGQAAIALDFAPGSTVDTNVIEKGTGKDVLENVKNLNVTITQ